MILDYDDELDSNNVSDILTANDDYGKENR